jgi:hypothetical protein
VSRARARGQDRRERQRRARFRVGESGRHPHDHRKIGGRVLARTVKKAGLEAVERDGYVVEHALTLTFHNLRYSDGSALIASYTQKLWMTSGTKAAYLPG